MSFSGVVIVVIGIRAVVIVVIAVMRLRVAVIAVTSVTGCECFSIAVTPALAAGASVAVMRVMAVTGSTAARGVGTDGMRWRFMLIG